MANAQDRSEEIEELEPQGSPPPQSDIQDRMAIDDSKSKGAWYKNFRVGYDKGLFVKTLDGDFYIKINGFGQAEFSVTESEGKGPSTKFGIKRHRIIFSGNVFRPWFLITVATGDDGEGLELTDVYLTGAFKTKYGEVITPRVGKFKVPFTREELTPSERLQFVDRSITSHEFAIDRESGAATYGVLGQYVTYGAGVFNGSRGIGNIDASGLVYAGRVQFTPCCGKLVYSGNSQFPSGGSYAYVPQNFDQRYKPTFAIAVATWGSPGVNTDQKSPSDALTTRFNEIFAGTDVEPVADVVGLTTDINFKYWPLSIEGDYEARWIMPKSIEPGSVFDQGFRVQFGIFLVPKVVEVAGRYAWITYDHDVKGKYKSWAFTPGLNFYLSRDNRWKVQLDYSYTMNEDTGRNVNSQNQFTAQLTAYF